MSKDHWSSEAYSSAAGFVPKLTTKVISYLDAQPNERILDIGCGDGILTAQIAQTVTKGQVFGLDASKSFIKTAQEKYTSSNCTFQYQDCNELEACPEAVDGSWDKVFSNAAMHWILRRTDTRTAFFNNINRCLKPNGKFVFEMGGWGNVAEVQAATVSALVHAGMSIDRAAEASPWFFPSPDWMTQTLIDAGFEVEVCEHEYRPTQSTPEKADGSGGLQGWVNLMCGEFVEPIGEAKKAVVLKEIGDTLDPIVTRQHDGTKWLGYCRLRAVARKK